MKITKIGHACLLIEANGFAILIDPGTFSPLPRFAALDSILITHEHPDHFDVEAIKQIRVAHPKVEIITHAAMGKVLSEFDIPSTTIAPDEVLLRKKNSIESIGVEHACIHHDLPVVGNCGFYLNERFFYPGDAFTLPKKPVEILALPVAAPWLDLEHCIEYAKAVAPEVVLPVHDGMLRPDRMTVTRRIPAMLLEKSGIRFVDMQDGWSHEF